MRRPGLHACLLALLASAMILPGADTLLAGGTWHAKGPGAALDAASEASDAPGTDDERAPVHEPKGGKLNFLRMVERVPRPTPVEVSVALLAAAVAGGGVAFAVRRPRRGSRRAERAQAAWAAHAEVGRRAGPLTVAHACELLATQKLAGAGEFVHVAEGVVHVRIVTPRATPVRVAGFLAGAVEAAWGSPVIVRALTASKNEWWLEVRRLRAEEGETSLLEWEDAL